MLNWRRLPTIACITVCATGVGCAREAKEGGRSVQADSSLADSPGATIRAITVSPAGATIAAGDSVQLTASALDGAGADVDVPLLWASRNAAVARVTASGLVTGVAGGVATVSASAGTTHGDAAVTVTGGAPPDGTVLIAAGDIAQCDNPNDEATAAVVKRLAGTVIVLGDNAYESGSARDYANCYAQSWGAFKGRTMPAVGNHEYQTAAARGYFDYFGAAAGERGKGYYSYDVADWHIVVLNSNCSFVSCAAGSPQERWLRADLAASTRRCTLAYWHHPRFNSGNRHGNDGDVGAFWEALYQHGAEVVLNGHEHLYERFAPQAPSGAADSARGVREFVVGTGGRALYSIGAPQPNSEVRNNDTFGVLQLTLGVGTYRWAFIGAAGGTFADSGSANCH
ncbi:MAG: Ig-like domain-containing protein [Gemmatimonadaceae bacterium]|nr:Ig-like domain-containing protein [Gemmatimonadaceae bacterium]